MPDAPARCQPPCVADRVNVRSRPSVSRGEIVTQLARGSESDRLRGGPALRQSQGASDRVDPHRTARRFSGLGFGGARGLARRHREGAAASTCAPDLRQDYAVLGRVAQGTALRRLSSAATGCQDRGAARSFRLTSPPPCWARGQACPRGSRAARGSAAGSGARRRGQRRHGRRRAAPGPTEHPLPRRRRRPDPASADRFHTACRSPTAGLARPGAAVAPSSPPPGRRRFLFPATSPPRRIRSVPSPSAVEISPEPRIVRREGIVRATFSVQAPTPFELQRRRQRQTPELPAATVHQRPHPPVPRPARPHHRRGIPRTPLGERPGHCGPRHQARAMTAATLSRT